MAGNPVRGQYLNAVSDRLTPDLLLRAYAMGIFPMADSRDATDIHWVEPRQRGIFPLDSFHVSRSLARHIRRTSPRVTVNTAFAEVMQGCAARETTWINAEIFNAYNALHDQGDACSLEVWQFVQEADASTALTLPYCSGFTFSGSSACLLPGP